MFDFIDPAAKKNLVDQIHSVMTDLRVSSWIDGYLTTARHFNSLGALAGVKECKDRYDNLEASVEQITIDGPIFEFGVATGRTTNCMAKKAPKRTVHGFDTFEGIPEPWHGHAVNKYSQGGKLPKVEANVVLHKGLFQDTLPGMLSATPGPASLIHIDCDLYSSTAFAFTLLKDRIRPGTVIVFDEYWNYPSWELHEHKAFMELLSAIGRRYRITSFVPTYTQLTVVIE